MIAEGDTIAAIATPRGAGGLGIVRISGPGTPEICRAVFRPSQPDPTGAGPEPGRARLGTVLGPGGEPLDRGYRIFFRGPHSYTGEDTAEITVHGSPFLLERLLDAVLAAGARGAEPGEFTYRAFRNGRLDLAQAEAVADLIAARTAHQARLAFHQMEGALARRLHPSRQALTDLVARLEASLEFPEEEGTLLPAKEIPGRIEAVTRPLREILESYTRGRLLRQGATVVLSGAPNVGKSSLFNRMVGDSRAIVTTLPGTTRDLLAESVELGGIPFRLVDTAGLGPSPDPIAAEGVRRAEEERRGADLVIFVLDRSRAAGPEERSHLAEAPPDTLVVLNKSDLPPVLGSGWVEEHFPGRKWVGVSALTGEGMERLEAMLPELLSPGGPDADPLLSRRRQRDELARCVERLEAARQSARDGRGEEVILLDLHEARAFLGRLTGELGLEEIYDRIFSTFCIGK